MRTLTETLMEEEAAYNSGRNYKTASSYMFGAEAHDIKINAPMFSFPEPPKCSSSCGSALGSRSGCGSARDFTPFDYNPQSVAEVFKTERSFSSSSHGSAIGGFISDHPGMLRREICDGLQERYDFSGHNNTSPHLNQDLIKAERDFNIKALENSHHIDLGFGRDKKKW